MTRTRGVIARVKGDGWEGGYNHFDSQPAILGHNLYAQWRQHFNKNTEAFLRFVIDMHPAGWASFPTLCYCHGQDGQVLARSSHDLRFYEEQGCQAITCDPLFIEWVYVFSGSRLTLLNSGPTDMDDSRAAAYPTIGAWFRHLVVGIWDLRIGEPSWERIPTSRLGVSEEFDPDRISRFVS